MYLNYIQEFLFLDIETDYMGVLKILTNANYVVFSKESRRCFEARFLILVSIIGSWWLILWVNLAGPWCLESW